MPTLDGSHYAGLARASLRIPTHLAAGAQRHQKTWRLSIPVSDLSAMRGRPDMRAGDHLWKIARWHVLHASNSIGSGWDMFYVSQICPMQLRSFGVRKGLSRVNNEGVIKFGSYN
jgi:hypothetical protein